MLAPDTDPSALAGLEIVDRDGERIGRVRQVYPDGGDLGWAGVRGNLIGTTEALVPLDRADLDDDVITLPITRARFLSAPRRTPDAPMDDEEREQLRAFYDEEPEPEPAPEPQAEEPEEEAETATAEERRAPRIRPGDREERRPKPLVERRPATTPAPPAPTDGSIARNEQRMSVSTEPVPRSRVVLRRVVVTEQRTITVPVRREELRVVREPIEDAEAVPGTLLDESEQELVLHEERVVVRTEVVPVERIRLVREVVTEQRDVAGEVWHEVIEAAEEP